VAVVGYVRISMLFLIEMPLVCYSIGCLTHSASRSRVERHGYDQGRTCFVSGAASPHPLSRNLEHFCNHYFIFLQSQPGCSSVHQSNNQCFACPPVCVPSVSVVLESRKAKGRTKKGKRIRNFPPQNKGNKVMPVVDVKPLITIRLRRKTEAVEGEKSRKR